MIEYKKKTPVKSGRDVDKQLKVICVDYYYY